MNKYFLYIKQKNQGCDYTVSCGEALIPLDSLTIDEAVKEVPEILEENGFGFSDTGYEGRVAEKAFILQPTMVNFDLKAWRDSQAIEMQSLAASNKSNQELIEYERLKKKFETK